MAKKKKVDEVALYENQVADYAPTDDFASKMSAKAGEDAKKEQLSEFKYIGGVKDGMFTLGDIELGETIYGVIIGTSYMNTFYDSKYDPKNPAPPKCFAVGLDEYELEAHETVPDPENAAPTKGKDKDAWEGSPCHSCPLNQFGSDGNGKACKNSRKLAFMPINGDFSDYDDQAREQLVKEGRVKPVSKNGVEFREILQPEDDEVYIINVSTTSLKHVKKYINECSKLLKYPVDCIFCSITLNQSANGNYFEFEMKPIDRLLESEYAVVESVSELGERGLLQPIPMEKKEAPKPAKRAVSNIRNKRN